MKSRYLSPAILLVCFVIAACATTTYNPFIVPEEEFHSKVNTIALAPVDVPRDLENPEPVKAMFESKLEARLSEGGVSVVPCKVVWQTQQQVIEELGGIHDPTTGEIDETRIEAVRVQTRQEVCKRFKADVLLYPKITLVEASFSKNKAHWDGVSEYVGTAGAIGLSFYRTWKGRITALTLVVEVQDIDGSNMYINYGGIQALGKISASGEFVPVPREKLFANETRNNKAVAIVTDPLVK